MIQLQAQIQVGQHDEQGRQHGGGGGHVDHGIHQILRGVGAQSRHHHQRQHDQVLDPGRTSRHAVLIQLDCLLAEDAGRDLGEEDLHRSRSPHQQGAEHGGEGDQTHEAVHQDFRQTEVGGQPLEHLHRAAGVFQGIARDKHVDQQGGDGVEHADEDAGDDDHLHKGFGAALDVVDVDRHRLGATGRHKDPGGNTQEGPAEIGNHGFHRDGVGRLHAADQGRARQQNVGECQQQHQGRGHRGDGAQHLGAVGRDIGGKGEQEHAQARGGQRSEDVLVTQEGVRGVGDDPRQQGCEEEEVHEPVGVGGDEGPATAKGTLHPGINPRFGVLIQWHKFRNDQAKRNEVKNGGQKEHRSWRQTDLDVVVDDVVETEYRRKGERQQTELAYRIPFGIRHGASPDL